MITALFGPILILLCSIGLLLALLLYELHCLSRVKSLAQKLKEE
jgi:hypothetical protein